MSDFDVLFNQLVFDDALTVNNVSHNSFLGDIQEDHPMEENLIKADPIMSDSLYTPDIEFPLPEIKFPKQEEDPVPVLEVGPVPVLEVGPVPVLEAISKPFDLPTDIGPYPKEESEDEKDGDDSIDWTPSQTVILARPNPHKRKMKIEPLTKSRPVPYGKKPKKLYEQKRFSDPVQEKNRQNAINAKINRDRKKKEKDALQTQMDMLRKENERLKKALISKNNILEKHGLL